MENYTLLELATINMEKAKNGSGSFADYSETSNFMLIQDQLNYKAFDDKLEVEPNSLKIIEVSYFFL